MAPRWRLIWAALLALGGCTAQTEPLSSQTCEGPNPGLDGPGCRSAINGLCLGDLTSGLICVDRTWVCPEGTIRLNECTRFDSWDAGASDRGFTDQGFSDTGYGDGTCTTINPSLAPERLYCLHATNGICCGDIGYAMVCTQGTWACEPGQIPYTQCIGNCQSPGDAGPID